MMEMLRSIINNLDTMKIILVDVISGLITASIIGIFTVIIKKHKRETPNDKPIYLSEPKRSFRDTCIGRFDDLFKIFQKIRYSIENSPIGKTIVIIGEEGVGKSLICYSLFKGQLKGCSVYLGWIDCIGKKSIFDIIKTTFTDTRFHRKSKEDILAAFDSLEKKCILFVDQIDQYTQVDELEELASISNVTLVLSGVNRSINFGEAPIEVLPFDIEKDKDIVHAIFEYYSHEYILLMKKREQIIVEEILKHTKGNPFLINAVAEAKYHYNGRWSDMLENLNKRVYSDKDYFKKTLVQLFRIDNLDYYEKEALSKLSTIKYSGFVEAVFELLNISGDCVESLCSTYWLNREDPVLYSMTEFRREVITKVLADKYNLRTAIEGLYNSLSRWGVNEDNGFRWVSLYVENILDNVQGYAEDLLDEEIFSNFSLEVACKYETINDKEKQLEWSRLCKNCTKESEYRKAYLELRAKVNYIDTLFSFSELNSSYLELQKRIEAANDNNRKRYFIEEYCYFLTGYEQYDDTISLCRDYFKTYANDLSNKYNCDVFFRYLQAANLLDDEETLKRLVTADMIQDLYQNDNISISAAWIFGELGKLYNKWGDKETSDRYIRHMVVLLNRRRCFFHDDIKFYLEISDEEFAEYMHSCKELLESLEEALQREDAEALYIEGRYQEKRGNYEDAFIRYQEAACRDSLRGMCSLALLYYRGQGEARDYNKARKYWEYCCEREHRGSYYWLGILLLDEDYPENDKIAALEHLKRAAELGSERAKQKMESI
ncbi:MAG: AAA family ATPase [Lachnospiraceae bacterium]|nr:AAA family ATPase [Lachnospiraceae bacterium]